MTLNSHNNFACHCTGNERRLFMPIIPWFQVYFNLSEKFSLNCQVDVFCLCFQEKLYSGSHNVVHIWDATGSFDLRGTIDHSLGSVYSLAVTKHFILVGEFPTLVMVVYNRNFSLKFGRGKLPST